MWFNINHDVNSHNLEWSVFAVVLLWSFVNPISYSLVAAAGADGQKKKRMGPGAAIYSVFTKHFMKEKLLFVMGSLAAVASAILLTYQGALINDLTRLVTRMTVNP